MNDLKDDDENYETFFCSGCGWRTTRLRGSFDFPVCAVCRWLDEADPSGALRTRWGRDRRLMSD